MVSLATVRTISRAELEQLPSLQARIDIAERWRTTSRWGDIDAPTLTSVLQRAERGDIADYADLVEYAITTSPELFNLYVTRIARVAQADYIVTPNKFGNPGVARLAAEFVNEQYARIRGFKNGLCELLHALALGFSASEMNLQRDGVSKTIYCDHLTHVHGHRFRYDLQWNLRLFDRGSRPGPPGAMGYGETLDPRLWIVHRHQPVAGYPGIAGIMRACIWYWMFTRWSTKWRLNYLEKYGSPFIRGEVPTGTAKTVRDNLLDSLTRMTAEHTLVYETGVKVEVDSAGSDTNSGKNFDDWTRFAIDEQTKAWLGTADAVQSGPNGARAATETRVSSVMDPRMVLDGAALCETLQWSLNEQLIRANAGKFGVPIESVPIPGLKLKTADDEIERDETAKVDEQRAEQQIRDTQARPYEVRGDETQPVADAPGPVAAAPAEDVQKQALNGAQVTSIVDIVTKVSANQMPRDAALGIIRIAFPGLTEQQVQGALGSAGAGFVPQTQAGPDPAPPEFSEPPPPQQLSLDPKVVAPGRQPGRTPKTAPTTSRLPSPIARALRGELVASVSSSSRASRPASRR